MKKLTALSLTLFSLSLAPAAFGQSLCHSYYNDTKRLSDNLASLDPNSPVVKSNIPKLYDSAMGCTQNCSGAEFTFCAGIAERIAKDDPTGMNRSHMSESQKQSIQRMQELVAQTAAYAPDPTRQWKPYDERMQTANKNNILTQLELALPLILFLAVLLAVLFALYRYSTKRNPGTNSPKSPS